MCKPVLTRRGFLTCAGATPLLAGCDDGFPVDLVSDETVEAMGLEAWDEITRSTEIAGNPEMQETLDTVSSRLLAAAGESPRDWEVVVFRGDQANAFALPGRKIGVFEGLFRITGSIDQLAAVVGHEIGHLQAEHGQERMSAQVAKQWGLNIIAWLLHAGDVQFAGEIAAALGLGVEFGLVLPYSRRQELEADELGLTTMAEAGYDPAEAVELWRRMEAASGARPPAFLATHPAPADRIAAIEAMLAGMDRG